MKELLIRNQRCLGCRSCELACAVEHSLSRTLTAAVNETPRPRYRVHVAASGGDCLPLQCRNCEEAACLNACLTGALDRDERGIVVCTEDLCIGCLMCIMVCPFGVITIDPDSRHVIKCDRCPEREEPACVAACPTGALVYREVSEATRDRRRAVLEELRGSLDGAD
jgi:carbon-monoxide dehydrogenase iron sulfur subunit